MSEGTEAVEEVGTPAWVLDQMELVAVRRSIAEEAFEELFEQFSPHSKKSKRVMLLEAVLKLMKEMQCHYNQIN